MDVIENLNQLANASRPVNRGVGLLTWMLKMKTTEFLKNVFLTPAAFATLPICLALALLMWGFTRPSYWRPYGDRGKIYETWQTSNSKFKVRVDAHYETGVFMGGAYYVFHSAPIGSDEWREIVWDRVDTEQPISHEMFRFVSDDVGYVSTSQAFAVTTDGGQCWSIWKPTEELKDWAYSFHTIKEVYVQRDGQGRMILVPFPDKKIEMPELQTSDYGHHWNVVQVTAKPNNSLNRSVISLPLIENLKAIR